MKNQETIKYKAKWRKETIAKRRLNKLCYRCASPNLYLNKALCKSCLDKKSLYGKTSKTRLRQKYTENNLCVHCGTREPKSFKHKNCEPCLSKYSLRAKKARPTKYKETWQKLFEHYGFGCNCCGETNKSFLCIDHINNDGNIQRKRDKVESGGLAFHIRIIKQNFPNDLQILCFNCNMGKYRIGGICPHTEDGQNITKEKFGE